MKKVLCKGPFLSQSGYGVQSRYALSALRKFPDRFDLYLINTGWGHTSWISEDNEERRFIDSLLQKTINHQQTQQGSFDISLQVRIPSEFEALAPINILYTAGIESTKMSMKWFEGAMKFNKIILTSNHSKFAFDNTTYPMIHNPTGQQFLARIETPMEVVGYPVRLFEAKEMNIQLKHDFNFLVVAQWGPRKNIENTIKWFIEEFKDKNVGLILKISTINNSLMDRDFTENRLKGFIDSVFPDLQKKCSIHFLHGDLTDEEMTYLYRHPKIKALITLGREGFGLPSFEAVYNGLPVITPAWGGVNDYIFMSIKNKKNKDQDTCMVANVSFDLGNIQPEAHVPDILIPESQWSFPREWDAKRQMREVYKNYGFHKGRALKLQEYIMKEYEANKMYQMFVDAICEDFNVINIESLLNEVPTNSMLSEVVVYD